MTPRIVRSVCSAAPSWHVRCIAISYYATWLRFDSVLIRLNRMRTRFGWTCRILLARNSDDLIVDSLDVYCETGQTKAANH